MRSQWLCPAMVLLLACCGAESQAPQPPADASVDESIPDAGPSDSFRLLYSRSSDMTTLLPLEGATIDAVVWIRLEVLSAPPLSIDRVEWLVDGMLSRNDDLEAPYDLTYMPTGFELERWAADGEHVVTARIIDTEGGLRLESVRFNVQGISGSVDAGVVAADAGNLTDASTPSPDAGTAPGVDGGAFGPIGSKPTDDSTGPRVALTPMTGGVLSGSHSGVAITGGVTANGPLTLTDCTIDGGITISDGPVVIDHCESTGWFGVVTNNTDPTKEVATVRFSKIIGPRDNDAMRIGSRSWGDHTRYMNTLFEDSIIYSPYDSFGPNQHFDLLQFGGGRSSVFRRVVFAYAMNPFSSQATNYVNNGANNPGVVMEDVWFEGGPGGYVLSGPMTITRCIISQSAGYYGDVYPAAGTTLVECFDELGNPISGT